MSSIIKVDTIQNQSGANIISESANTITVGASGDTITIPSAVKVADNVSGGDGSSNTITAPNTGRYLYEFLTPDAGTTILMHQIGKMYT